MEIASNDDLISAQFINLHLWWYMGALVSMELAPCTSVKASVLKDIRATYALVQIMSFSGQLESYIRQECDRNWRPLNHLLCPCNSVTAGVTLHGEYPSVAQSNTDWNHI